MVGKEIDGLKEKKRKGKNEQRD